VTNEALEIHGGYGRLVEKLYRDAKVTRIYECPNELFLRVTVAKMLELGMQLESDGTGHMIKSL
jgi:alkylation response protein AidB-like acyl-CoA dehydrogenase